MNDCSQGVFREHIDDMKTQNRCVPNVTIGIELSLLKCIQIRLFLFTALCLFIYESQKLLCEKDSTSQRVFDDFQLHFWKRSVHGIFNDVCFFWVTEC